MVTHKARRNETEVEASQLNGQRREHALVLGALNRRETLHSRWNLSTYALSLRTARVSRLILRLA